MNDEHQIMQSILTVAENDDRIRAVYMNGSRTNPTIDKDVYQDYDVVYVVKETESFLKDKNWVFIFGEMAMIQEPDANDLGWGENNDFTRRYAWLMLFKDGNRIDLTIQTIEEAESCYLSDKLTLCLLDKDGILPTIPSPTDVDYHVKKPTKERYLGCCNEFWWCLNNVAKGIARDELPFAMEMFNSYVRDMLNCMVEWTIGINTDFSVSAGKMGKFFKKYLEPELYLMYQKTYSDSSYDNIWNSVFIACKLFRMLALDVAKSLGFTYNMQDDENMIIYLINVKDRNFER